MELNSLNVDLFQNFLGVIFESENDANGIQKILQELHGYVPYVGDFPYVGTLLNNFDLQKFYNWISDHKGYMILHRKAR